MMKINIHSLRFKASILYSVILAVILLTFSSVIFLNARSILFQDMDEELKIKAEEISGILNAYDQMRRTEEHPISQILERFKSRTIGSNQKMIIDEIWRAQVDVLNLKDDYINIVNANGQAVLISHNFSDEIAGLLREKFPAMSDRIIYRSVIGKKHRLRVINMPVQLSNLSFVIQVGTSQVHVEKTLKEMLTFISVAILVLLLLTSFVGRVFIHHALKPVREVIDLANTISHKDLNQRIQEKKVDAEMKQLVDSFNSMISRLSKSFNHINEFSSHAAHELKTPLAIMRGEIELALDDDRSPSEYKKLLEGCLEEIDHMIKVIKDLLFLAKLDYKPEIFHFERMSLVPFLEEIYGHSQVLAETKQIKVTRNFPEPEIFVHADKVHLRRLFFNIISNAIKFTPPQGTVEMSVYLQEGKCCVDIKDSGDGIPADVQQKIFDKFFRVPQDDESSPPGTGLGLSIALSVAKAHNGDIQVKSALHQGATFIVILPVI